MKNNFIKNNLLGFIALVVSLSVGLSYWKSHESRKYAFVDSKRLMTGFKEAQRLDKELKEEDGKWRATLKGMEDSIKAYMDTMSVKYDHADGKTKKAMQDELSTLNQRSNNFEHFQVKRMQDMTNKKMEQVYEKINVFMKDYGRLHGYEIIFGTVNGSILYGDGTPADITEHVVQALNQRYE